MKSIMNLNRLIPGLALIGLLAWSSAPAQATTAASEAGPPEITAQMLADYRQKVEPLQDQLWAKEVEVEALSRTGNIPELRVAAAEVIKLRAQIREERRQLVGPGWGGNRVFIRGEGPGLGSQGPEGHRAALRSKTWADSHNRAKGSPGQGCRCW